jgi:hypothetical protein
MLGTGICWDRDQLPYENMGVFETFASVNGFILCGYNTNGLLLYDTVTGLYAVIKPTTSTTYVFDYQGVRYKAVALVGNKIQLYKSPI